MAMSKHAAGPAAVAGPVVVRQVEATTICFSEDPAPANTGYLFAVMVTCYVKRSLDFRGHGQRPYVLEQEYIEEGGDTATTFLVRDLSTLRSDGACRWALRGMLAELSQVRALDLPEDEWDAVVPADVVPQIVRLARGDDASYGFTFCFAMEVNWRFIHGELALLMACKEWELGGSKRADDCPICLDGLELEGQPAVELPCKHPFHSQCISTWFSKETTCPMCRGDVRLCALPEFLNL
ncbi:hypothetical protein VPH35_062741 [Triticum aestivum]|nr:E3 ubiquitin-protein ligase RING1-like [Triticum aestivum]